MWTRVLALLLTGCQVVFPLEARDTCPEVLEPRCGVNDPNEDGDDLRDDCDLCPQSELPTADSDGDLIGDDCDPHPADKAVCSSRRFFSLTTAAGWLDTTGWLFDGDAFTEDPSASVDRLIQLRSIDQLGRGRLEGVLDDGQGVDSSLIGFTAMLTEDDGYFCGIAMNRTLIARLVGDQEQILREGTTGLGYTPGVRHRVRFTIAPRGALTCEIAVLDSDGSADVSDTLTYTDPAPLTGGSIGIAERSSDASFRYVDFVPD